MEYRFFSVPVMGGEQAEAELNGFMAQNRVLSVERKFIEDGAASQWAFCIGFEGDGARQAAPPRKSSVDYREVLNDQDFALFSRLRVLRKELAERDGVPPYAVFTNEQLAAIVQRRVVSKAALQEIDGVGAARIEKYAAPVLRVMEDAPPLAAEGQEAVNAA